MSKIHVTIDRLAMPGLEIADRRALVEALEGELRAILADPAGRSEWARSHSTPVLRLQPMRLEKGVAGDRQFGTKMARAIGKGLKP